MTNPIRIISHTESTHCDVVQVYRHQIIVKRLQGKLSVECFDVTEIGNVPCDRPCVSKVCWHAKAAIDYLAGLKDEQVTWCEDEDTARWTWGTRLDNHIYPVESKQGRAWIVVHEEQTNVNQTE